MSSFDLVHSSTGELVAIRWKGELDFVTRREFEKEVIALVKRCSSLEIDLSTLDYIDSSGIAGLINVAKAYAKENKYIVVSGANANIRSGFKLINLGDALTHINQNNIIK